MGTCSVHVHCASLDSIQLFNRHIKVFQLISSLLNIKVPSVTRLFVIVCNKYFSYTMKIRFNHVISVAVLAVFVVTSAKNIPQNPGANNQSGPAKPSARILSNKINFQVSHTESPEKSTTFTNSKPTTVTSAASTTAVTSINTAATTIIKIPGPVNNTISTTSIKGMTGIQSVIIANVGMENENRTDGEVYLNMKNLINPPALQDPPIKNQCPTGYTIMPNGDCKPKFVDH